MKTKVCVFDVDGTLTHGFYLVRFAEALSAQGLISKVEAARIKEIFEAFKNGECSYEDAAQGLVNAFGAGILGRSQDDLETAGKRYLASHANEKFRYTDSLIEFVKSMGYRTIVISGSPIDVIRPFSLGLGIDDIFATSYEVDGKLFTGNVALNCALNEVKGQIVDRYFQVQEVDLETSAGFGDTHHDMAFLERVKFPVALNPNSKLEEIAKEKKWLVCREGDQVVDLVRAYIQ